MANFHLTAKSIGRSSRNTVAAVAYRTGTQLTNTRTGDVSNYADKSVGHVELIAQDDLAEWAASLQSQIAYNRTKGVQAFVDVMEAAEKRVDAQVYREVEFSLPNELTNEQNIKLAREFLKDQCASRGMLVLASFHFDVDEKTGIKKPHCHALLSLREVEEHGLSNHKNREWNSKELLQTLREQWAAYQNFHLAKRGFESRVDHRSYEDQGIDLDPQPKIGRRVREMEERSSSESLPITDKGKELSLQNIRNLRKILRNPELVFTLASRREVTFTWDSVTSILQSFVGKSTHFYALEERLRHSSSLIEVSEEGASDIRYITKETLAIEHGLVQRVKNMGQAKSHPVKESTLRASLRFGNTLIKDQRGLRASQIKAIRGIVANQQVSNLVGYAGAGKTTCLKVASHAWENEGYSVVGLAPTGRARDNISDLGIKALTLSSFLHQYDRGQMQLSADTVFVLDEAGMVGTHDFDRLTTAVKTLDVKLVLVGDSGQLKPIAAGDPYRLLTKVLAKNTLRTVVRQHEAWQRKASVTFGRGDTQKALQSYATHGHVIHAGKEQLIKHWKAYTAEKDISSCVILAHTRKDVEALNLSARKIMRQGKKLKGRDHTIQISRINEDKFGNITYQNVERSFARGDRIIFTKNDKGLNVSNSMMGTIIKLQGTELRVEMDGEHTREVSFSTNLYRSFDHAYAITIHKTQGVTVNKSFIYASPYMDKNLTYVAMTRHRMSADLYVDPENFKSIPFAIWMLSRDHSKKAAHDFVKRTIRDDPIPDETGEEPLGRDFRSLQKIVHETSLHTLGVPVARALYTKEIEDLIATLHEVKPALLHHQSRAAEMHPDHLNIRTQFNEAAVKLLDDDRGRTALKKDNIDLYNLANTLTGALQQKYISPDDYLAFEANIDANRGLMMQTPHIQMVALAYKVVSHLPSHDALHAANMESWNRAWGYARIYARFKNLPLPPCPHEKLSSDTHLDQTTPPLTSTQIDAHIARIDSYIHTLKDSELSQIERTRIKWLYLHESFGLLNDYRGKKSFCSHAQRNFLRARYDTRILEKDYVHPENYLRHEKNASLHANDPRHVSHSKLQECAYRVVQNKHSNFDLCAHENAAWKRAHEHARSYEKILKKGILDLPKILDSKNTPLRLSEISKYILSLEETYVRFGKPLHPREFSAKHLRSFTLDALSLLQDKAGVKALHARSQSLLKVAQTAVRMFDRTYVDSQHYMNLVEISDKFGDDPHHPGHQEVRACAYKLMQNKHSFEDLQKHDPEMWQRAWDHSRHHARMLLHKEQHPKNNDAPTRQSLTKQQITTSLAKLEDIFVSNGRPKSLYLMEPDDQKTFKWESLGILTDDNGKKALKDHCSELYIAAKKASLNYQKEYVPPEKYLTLEKTYLSSTDERAQGIAEHKLQACAYRVFQHTESQEHLKECDESAWTRAGNHADAYKTTYDYSNTHPEEASRVTINSKDLSDSEEKRNEVTSNKKTFTKENESTETKSKANEFRAHPEHEPQAHTMATDHTSVQENLTPEAIHGHIHTLDQLYDARQEIDDHHPSYHQVLQDFQSMALTLLNDKKGNDALYAHDFSLHELATHETRTLHKNYVAPEHYMHLSEESDTHAHDPSHTSHEKLHECAYTIITHEDSQRDLKKHDMDSWDQAWEHAQTHAEKNNLPDPVQNHAHAQDKSLGLEL